jgi:KTSC domain
MPSTSLPVPLINSHPVDSSSLASVAYDGEQKILQIEFRDRSVYQYSRVPVAIYEELWQAESKGVYYNRQIRPRFAHARVL